MKKSVWLLLAVCLQATAAYADQWGGFAANADSGSLKPFARDLGGLLGSAAFHSGRSLGLAGWDIGVQGGVGLQPDKNDRIMRNNGVSSFGTPWVQAEIGLPFNISGFIRGVSAQGLTVSGGGLRYGVYAPSEGILEIIPSIFTIKNGAVTELLPPAPPVKQQP